MQCMGVHPHSSNTPTVPLRAPRTSQTHLLHPQQYQQWMMHHPQCRRVFVHSSTQARSNPHGRYQRNKSPCSQASRTRASRTRRCWDSFQGGGWCSSGCTLQGGLLFPHLTAAALTQSAKRCHPASPCAHKRPHGHMQAFVSLHSLHVGVPASTAACLHHALHKTASQLLHSQEAGVPIRPQGLATRGTVAAAGGWLLARAPRMPEKVRPQCSSGMVSPQEHRCPLSLSPFLTVGEEVCCDLDRHGLTACAPDSKR